MRRYSRRPRTRKRFTLDMERACRDCGVLLTEANCVRKQCNGTIYLMCRCQFCFNAAVRRARDEKRGYCVFPRSIPRPGSAVRNRCARSASVIPMPMACEHCGKIGDLWAYHADYNSPYVVAWICTACFGPLQRIRSNTNEWEMPSGRPCPFPDYSHYRDMLDNYNGHRDFLWQDEMQALIAVLSPTAWFCILRWLDGWSGTFTGKILGVSRQRVNQLLQRAWNKLWWFGDPRKPNWRPPTTKVRYTGMVPECGRETIQLEGACK